MSEPENFIARWARRKAAAQDAEARPAAAPATPATRPDGEGDRKENDAARAFGGPPKPSAAAFDPTKLPPIESITAETDIRAFLVPGVPAHLTRAALRRAWASDPKIRDFIGLSENSWDFNAPDAIAGFGPLEMTDELRREVARLVGRSIAGTAGDAAALSEEIKETPSPTERTVLYDATGCTEPLTQDAGKPGEPDRAAV